MSLRKPIKRLFLRTRLKVKLSTTLLLLLRVRMLIREIIRADIRFVLSFHELVKCFAKNDRSKCIVRPQISR